MHIDGQKKEIDKIITYLRAHAEYRQVKLYRLDFIYILYYLLAETDI